MVEEYNSGDVWITKDRPRGKVRVIGEHLHTLQSGEKVADGSRLKVEILIGVRAGTIIDIRKDWLLKKLKGKY